MRNSRRASGWRRLSWRYWRRAGVMRSSLPMHGCSGGGVGRQLTSILSMETGAWHGDDITSAGVWPAEVIPRRGRLLHGNRLHQVVVGRIAVVDATGRVGVCVDGAETLVGGVR